MSKRHIAWASVVALAVLIPGVTLAQSQSGIAGVVRDTSGAVLPGVTVEAASPVLIEKVRTAVTDGEGAYKLLDLRPGTYTVTFVLPGFSRVRRDGIELPAAFTATVSVELAVGAVEETITVSGAAPLVDVQSAKSERRLPLELLESIPASRSPQGYVGLTPGTTNQGLAVIPGGVQELEVMVHGAPVNESIWTVDGMSTAGMNGLGGGSNVFRIAEAYVSEINVTTGGGTAEQQYGGMVTNVIPKDGGNTFHGGAYGEFMGSGMTTTNLTPALEARGFTENSLQVLRHLWDVSPSFGGRIRKDKLWFFGSYRDFGVVQTRAGVFDNLTPRGDVYTPDVSNPAVAKITQLSRNLRLTLQATPKNKISLFGDFAPQIVWHRPNHSNFAVIAPEATTYTPYIPNRFLIGSWKSTVTNRWLLDASISQNSVDFTLRRQTHETCSCSAPDVGYGAISTVEATTNTMWRATSAEAGITLNYAHYASHTFQYAGNASYVTGSHAAKFGVRLRTGAQWFTQEPNGSISYLFRNGAPVSLTQYATEIRYENQTRSDLGLFAQDQWTLRRLTLTGGLRWDYYDGGAAPETLEAGPWVPARSFPGTDHAPQWKDLAPRMAASYDLFGDGKTAIKASFGRFVAGYTAGTTAGTNQNNPVVRSVLQVTRTWNDLNRSFSPDCDLVNRFANGECGQVSNLNFGQNNPNATTYDEEILHGLRGYNWETTAVVQRQLARGVSVTAGYYRREFGNFLVSQNQLVTPADFSHYCFTAPLDPQLPGGGGNQICGLYDVSPALFGRNRTLVLDASHFGTQTQIYDGIDLTENIRFANSATISGGLNWGRTKTNNCFVVDTPEALRFCDIRPPMLPTATFIGFVPLHWGMAVSATYRDFPGPQITANLLVTNAQIAPSLGRNLSNGVNGTVTKNLIQPGTMYEPRNHQVDFRVSKRIRLSNNRRIMANLDLFNLFNATGVDAINAQYGPNWQRPVVLQIPRYVKISGQFDF